MSDNSNKEMQYNNMCLAIMANLQGFYRQDGAFYLGRINLKSNKDKILLLNAVYCSNINEDSKIHIAVHPITYFKIKKKYGDKFIRDSYYSANADYDTKKMEDMLEFVQNAYGYSRVKEEFKVFDDIYESFYSIKKKEKKK